MNTLNLIRCINEIEAFKKKTKLQITKVYLKVVILKLATQF